MRPGDNKIRISGAWQAAVTGDRAWDLPYQGLALPKFVERGNFSLNYLVIRLLSLKMDHQTEAGQPKCRPTNVRGAVNGLGYRNTLSCSLHTAG